MGGNSSNRFTSLPLSTCVPHDLQPDFKAKDIKTKTRQKK